MCISSWDIIMSSIQNPLVLVGITLAIWAISGVGAVCIVVGLEHWETFLLE